MREVKPTLELDFNWGGVELDSIGCFKSVPDFLANSWYKNLLKHAKAYSGVTSAFPTTSAMLNEIRLGVMRDEINVLPFEFNGIEITIGSNGQLSCWPDGFFDERRVL